LSFFFFFFFPSVAKIWSIHFIVPW
jgi:hypothetical protein